MMFVLRRGPELDPSADILTEPAAFAYEWEPVGHPSPKLFRSESIASMFGRTMLAGSFHVTLA